METINASELLAALGHETRLTIFRLLVEAGPAGINASAIGEKVGLAPATLSFHLAHLTRVGLIKGKQQGRFIFYSTDYALMDELLAFLTNNCCQGQGNTCLPKSSASDTTAKRRNQISPQSEGSIVSERIFNVLFLCTGNSARSILAEAILNHLGQGRFRAYSAGSHPAGQVNAQTLELLVEQGMPVADLRSKSWDEFARADAPPLDFVFTVCDDAAGEVCPVWPGQPVTAHWGVADPVSVSGDDEAKRWAVSAAYRLLSRRISIFTSLPFAKLDAIALQREVDAIGQQGEATA